MNRLSASAAAATVMVAAAAFALLAPGQPANSLGATDATPPEGFVGGVRSPASGTLELRVTAYDDGAGLAIAQALLDDEVTSVNLSGDSVSAVPLPVDTRSVADGDHRLTVEVTDAAGNTATLVDRTIAVRNAPPPSGGAVATLTVGITSDSGGSSGGDNGNGKGGGKGKGKGKGRGIGPVGPPCRWPRLRMRLIARPLWRTRPGRLPVLRFRKRHLYRGWLTCRVGGRRSLALPGTRVEVFYRIWRRSFRKRRGPIKVRKGAIRVRPNGRLWVRLGFLSGRTVIFRYRSPDGGVARSKLRIAIARTDPPRRGQ